MATHIAESEHAVLYVTSEDTPATLLAKTISRKGKIPYSAVRHGYENFRDVIDREHTTLLTMPTARYLRYVDATQGITLDGIYEQALDHFTHLKDQSKGTPVIVVDYLQRLSRCENLGVDARQSTTIFVERLRAMACDLHCTVILLSAMNRASGYSAGGTTIASAKESGDIEYTADVIMAVGPQSDMDEIRPGVRRWMLRIDKNRQGDTTYDGKHIDLEWQGALQTFTEPNDDIEKKSESVESEAPAANGRNGRRRR
jgi:replicative DNA helicase